MRSLHRGLLFGRGLTSGLPSASAGLAARAKLKAVLLEPTMAAEPSIRVLEISRAHSVFSPNVHSPHAVPAQQRKAGGRSRMQ